MYCREGTPTDAAGHSTECSSMWLPLLNDELPVDSEIYEGQTREPLERKTAYSFAIQVSEYDDVTCVDARGSIQIPAGTVLAQISVIHLRPLSHICVFLNELCSLPMKNWQTDSLCWVY